MEAVRRHKIVPNADLALRRQLALLKGLPNEESIGRIRMTEGDCPLPALVDVGAILSNKTGSNAARDLDHMLERWPELATKFRQVNFEGRGGHRKTWVPKDAAALVEYIFLLPGTAAANIRRAAAQAFVYLYGEDLQIIGKLECLPHVQEALGSEGALVSQSKAPTTQKKPDPPKSLLLPGTPLVDLVKAHRPEVQGAQFRLLQMKVSLRLVETVAADLGKTLQETEETLQTGRYGQKTRVPPNYIKVAIGLLRMDKELNVTNGAQPAPDIARDAQVPEEPRSKRARQGFRATTFSHIAAKAAANALFLKCLRAHSIPKEAPIVILDAYSASMGFELRSLSALQQAGFRNVYIVNPDEGICNAALGQGAMVFKGTWEEASAAWLAGDQRFAAFYLDLCSGSAAYIERQLRLAFDLALNTVVVAYTILERDFDGFPFIQRLKRLDDLMLGQNWQPGLVGWEASSLAYRTSAGHQAVTETWYR